MLVFDSAEAPEASCPGSGRLNDRIGSISSICNFLAFFKLKFGVSSLELQLGALDVLKVNCGTQTVHVLCLGELYSAFGVDTDEGEAN